MAIIDYHDFVRFQKQTSIGGYLWSIYFYDNVHIIKIIKMMDDKSPRAASFSSDGYY